MQFFAVLDLRNIATQVDAWKNSSLILRQHLKTLIYSLLYLGRRIVEVVCYGLWRAQRQGIAAKICRNTLRCISVCQKIVASSGVMSVNLGTSLDQDEELPEVE